MAEGAGSAYEVSKEIEKRIDLETRVVVLGHIQRGGTPPLPWIELSPAKWGHGCRTFAKR